MARIRAYGLGFKIFGVSGVDTGVRTLVSNLRDTTRQAGCGSLR